MEHYTESAEIISTLPSTLFIIAIAAILAVLFAGVHSFLKTRLHLEKTKIPLLLLWATILLRILGKQYFSAIGFENIKLLFPLSTFVAFYSLIRIGDSLFSHLQVKRNVASIPKVFHDLVLFVLYSIIILAVLRIEMGIDLTPVLTTSAVLSMVIGLALQDTLTNFISGIVIHMEKPYKINDWVVVNGVEGRVVEINWRTTKVLTLANDFLIIPNTSIAKDSIVNFSYPTPVRLTTIEIGVSYREPPNRVKKALLSVVKTTDGVLISPAPTIRLVEYNDSSIDYRIIYWISDNSQRRAIENEIMSKVWYTFRREGIEIPYPKRDIYIHYPENSGDGKEDIIKSIRSVDFFSELEDEVVFKIAEKMKETMYGKSEKIVVMGQEASSFYIIMSGLVDVTINGKVVATLRKGDFFGEMSLFTGKRASATVTATEDVLLLQLNKDGFNDVLLSNMHIVETISDSIAKRELCNEKQITSHESSIHHTRVKKRIFDNIMDFFNITTS